MERTLEFDLLGKKHRFLYTASVMYDAMDKYELNIDEILDLTGAEKSSAIFYLANEMAKAAGSSETYDNKEYTPLETLLLETAVIQAIVRANRREVKPETVSKTLAKIEKKKARVLLARIFLWLLLRCLGFPLKKRIKHRSE